MSTTVRVSDEVRDKIKTIAEKKGISIQFVIEKAVNFYQKELFLEELNEAYAKAGQEDNDNLWDNTLMDGLDHEDWDQDGKVIKKI